MVCTLPTLLLEIWTPNVPSAISITSNFSGFLIGWDKVTCSTSGCICEWKRGRACFTSSSRMDSLWSFAVGGWVSAISTQMRMHKLWNSHDCYSRWNRKERLSGRQDQKCFLKIKKAKFTLLRSTHKHDL